MMLLPLLLLLAVGAVARPQCPAGLETTTIRTKRQLMDCLGLSRDTLDIPRDIQKLSMLTSLQLNGRELRKMEKFIGSVPSELKQLSRLEMIDIAYNRIYGFPFEQVSANVPGLKRLELTSNLLWENITSTSFRGLDVVHLGLEKNDFELAATEAFTDLSSLTYLNLQSNRMLEVALDARKMQKLRYLNLDSTRARDLLLDEPMSDLRYLTVRYMQDEYKATRFPAVRGMRNLRYLSVSNTNFGGLRLPEGVWDMPSLLELGVQLCNLTGPLLDDSVNMPLLSHIRAVENSFTGAFPLWNTPMPEFVAARLTRNRFTTITANVSALSGVLQLSLQDNEISELAADALPLSIKALNVSNNRLTYFPSAIAGLTNLDRLFLSNNSMRGTVPEGLARLENLQFLYLAHQQLSGRLPRIDRMLNARQFLLNDNFFTGTIPKGISEAKKLEYLDLSTNRLAGVVDPGMGRLQKLRGLHLRNNPDLRGVFPFAEQLPRTRVVTLTNTSFQVDRSALLGDRVLFNEFFTRQRRVSLYMPTDELEISTHPLVVQYDEETPGPPGTPRAILVFENDAQLVWQAPQEPNGDIMHYDLNVTRLRDGMVTFVDSAVSSATVRNLLDSHEYLISVRGTTSAGPGEWSAPLLLRTLSSCPDGRVRLRCLGGECPRNFVRDVPEDPGCVRFCDGAEGTMPLLGARCDNSSLEELSLEAGFWRAGPASTDVLACPRPAYCRPPETAAVRRQLQQQGSSASYCSSNHRGVFCWECAEGYALQPDGCQKCTEERRAHERGLIAAFAIICVLFVAGPALFILGRAWWHARKKASEAQNPPADQQQEQPQPQRSSSSPAAVKPAPSQARRAVSRMYSAGLGAVGVYRNNDARVRIAIGFYQVYLLFCRVFGLLQDSNGWQSTRAAENDDVEAGFDALVQFDVSRILGVFSVKCVAPNANFYAELLLYTLLPLASGLVALFTARVAAKCMYNKSCPSAYSQALSESTWYVLLLTFLVYPGVSAKITSAFLFERFDPGVAGEPEIMRLQADYSLPYSSSSGWTAYAAAMVFVYPIGVPCFYLFWLRRKRTGMLACCCGCRTRRSRGVPNADEDADTFERHASGSGSGSRSAHSGSRSDSSATGDPAIPPEQAQGARDAFSLMASKVLARPYVRKRDWYEPLELVRKLLLTSGFLVVNQFAPTASPVVFQLLLLFAFAAHSQLQPWRERSDAKTAEAALGLLALLSLLPLLQRLRNPESGDVVLSEEAGVVLAATIGALMLLPLFWYAIKPKAVPDSAKEKEDKEQPQIQTEADDEEPFAEKSTPEGAPLPPDEIVGTNNKGKLEINVQ